MQDDTEARIDTDELKQMLSGRLYHSLAEFHNKLEEESDSSSATDVILTALSVNLGHIIGQLPPKSRRHALKTTRKIIQDQVSEVAKMSDAKSYGQIGHA